MFASILEPFGYDVGGFFGYMEIGNSLVGLTVRGHNGEKPQPLIGRFVLTAGENGDRIQLLHNPDGRLAPVQGRRLSVNTAYGEGAGPPG